MPSVAGYLPPITLHPILKHDTAGRMLFNVSQPLDKISFNPHFPVSPTHHCSIPSLSELVLKFPGSLRPRIVRCSGAVTLSDVLSEISQHMREPLDQAELMSLPASMRQKACAYSRGHGIVLRYHCLGDQLYFVGLSRRDDGMFEPHFMSHFG